MREIVVIGGGAAGMMAAVAAAGRGSHVTLLEKNEKLGKKIYITGKGRCNFTNACEVQQLFAAVVSNPKFLYSAFYGFTNEMVMEFFGSRGMPFKVERGNRVFPVSDHSSDVIRALQRTLEEKQVNVLLHTRVLSVEQSQGAVTGVRIRDQKHRERFVKADRVIVAAGGCSYPSTGSDGDGYAWGKEMGHRITPLRPALVPLVTKEAYIPLMQGLSLKNVELSLKNQKGKICYREFGEMLFTHFGISGPLVLSASSVVGALLEKEGELTGRIDLKPALSSQQLEERLLREFSANANRQLSNVMRSLLPSKMVEPLIGLSGISQEKPAREITREERARLVELLKAFPFTVCGTRGFREAIITQGGISVKDINPSTMESRKVRGLYFAGEVLDLDALTGGYNLQIAWSTGHLAGCSAAEEAGEDTGRG